MKKTFSLSKTTINNLEQHAKNEETTYSNIAESAINLYLFIHTHPKAFGLAKPKKQREKELQLSIYDR